jgi:transposase InsO family protein
LRRPVESGPYTSSAFIRRLAGEGLVGSIGTVGDALDNAMCESLIGTMTIEKLKPAVISSVEDVRAAVCPPERGSSSKGDLPHKTWSVSPDSPRARRLPTRSRAKHSIPICRDFPWAGWIRTSDLGIESTITS